MYNINIIAWLNKHSNMNYSRHICFTVTCSFFINTAHTYAHYTLLSDRSNVVQCTQLAQTSCCRFDRAIQHGVFARLKNRWEHAPGISDRRQLTASDLGTRRISVFRCLASFLHVGAAGMMGSHGPFCARFSCAQKALFANECAPTMPSEWAMTCCFWVR